MTFLSRNLRSGADLPPSRSRKGRSARYRWHHFRPEPPHQGRSAHQPRRWLHRGPERFSLGRHGGRSQDWCVAVSFAPMFLHSLVLSQVTSSAPALSLNSGLSLEDPALVSHSLEVRLFRSRGFLHPPADSCCVQDSSSSSPRHTPASTTRRLSPAPSDFLPSQPGAQVRRLPSLPKPELTFLILQSPSPSPLPTSLSPSPAASPPSVSQPSPPPQSSSRT